LWVVRKIVKEGGRKLAELESLDGEPAQSKVVLDDIVPTTGRKPIARSAP
jgi:hypothetical protein